MLRFLEHNVCFRATLDNDTLLIFPGLIKQKRPLDDDFPATDDVSYVVRGRVENIYAMLVVLLGYTPSFIRINHWQKQAQYAMGENEICGFRMIEDREGEIELVLYYSTQMPDYGREQFQELFERFLYKRDVQVTRFPPVSCSNGHLLERATVVGRIRDNKTFAFCAECGDRVDLPDLERSDIGTDASDWLKREEATARLRSIYEQHLLRVKGYRRGWATPRCYLSFAPAQGSYAQKLTSDLQDAGIYVIEEAEQVQSDDYVLVLDTPNYRRLWDQPTSAFEVDKKLVQDRFNNTSKLISLKLEDSRGAARSHDLSNCTIGDFCDATHYPVSLFNLVLNLYSIPLTHASFKPLRQSLHQQWEQMPREASIEDNDNYNYVQTPGTKTENKTEGVGTMSEQYVNFDLHIAPNGYAVASSILEGEATADISTEVPSSVALLLDSINKRQVNADMLKLVGKTLYDWLFPSSIHTHLHQWEAIIQEALVQPLANDQITLQTVKRATRKEIRNALLKQKPDIIQFVGHGIYKDGKGYLALVDDQTNKTWLVDDEQFANLYLGHDDHLGLISLATCESAKSHDPQGFVGIAPKLVQRGIPSVLSMQYKVLIKTAEIFLEDFYTAVAARKPIDWATQSARNAVSQVLGLENREFGTPVLYMRAQDGNVF